MPFTVSCWFKTDSASQQQGLFVSQVNGSANGHWLYLNNANKLNMLTYDGSSVGATSSVSWQVNEWQHAVGMVAGTNWRRSYLNGGDESTDYNNQNSLTIGTMQLGSIWWAGSQVSHFSGLVVMPAVWNRLLTATEVEELYGDPWGLITPRRRTFFWSAASPIAAGTDVPQIMNSYRRRRVG